MEQENRSIKASSIGFDLQSSREEQLEDCMREILTEIDENPYREGLLETPKRYLKFLREFTNPDEFKLTTFKNEGYDEMIVQTNIPFHSLCEHHVAPFFGKAAVAYIPKDRIVGLSKLARTVEYFSRRLQNQERITSQVADFLMQELDAEGVAVHMNAQHLCMEMRGIKKHDTFTSTTKLLGSFKNNNGVKEEFFDMIKLNKQ